MKKTIYMLGCLSIVLLPNIACSNLDSNESTPAQVETASLLQPGSGNVSTGKFTVDPALITKAGSIMRDEIKNNAQLAARLRKPPIVNGQAQYVDQAILDHLISITNLSQYSSQITVDMVNRMIAESVEMEKVGYESYIKNTKYISTNMKDYFNRLAYDDVTAADFQTEANFINLSDNEQSVLYNMDSLVTYSNTSKLIGGGFGMLFGAGIGGMIFGPAGFIVGAVIGFAFGSLIDK
ncbi:MAG: hypothetical protein MUW56_14430 [Chryseobacterium sp.]|uniref:hypothetical protein n=1 Tax=Chryseobacterium sp. TaxID=1871047 RepID=UPI0025C40150|nr:hypothetical protein [Chryseobacterium sp.]MCJ7934783.1 hypothetical protein [Chryseobacterium sp.]